MYGRLALPVVFLSLLALRELDQGVAFVAGTWACWSGLCLAASAATRALRDRSPAVTIAAQVALTWLFALAVWGLEPRFWPSVDPIPSAELLGESVVSMHLALLCWSFMTYVPDLRAEAHARRLEAERAVREAELASLRERLTPHFLRNTLHTVSALSLDDAERARSLMSALAHLLEDPGPGDVEPLGQQLAWLRSYVAILEARFEGRLRFEFVVEPGLEGHPLPRLLLQPLVENAVEHGALQREGPSTVRVVACRDGQGGLVLAVEDDGPGHAATADSLGLFAVRRRLELALPEATLRVALLRPGTRVTIALPLRSGPSAASSGLALGGEPRPLRTGRGSR